MKCRVLITDSAAEQIEANDLWWHVNRPRAPGLFRAELERAVDLLASAPEIGPLCRRARRRGTRRLVLRKSKRWVYYCYDRRLGVVTVVAVWGTERGAEPPEV